MAPAHYGPHPHHKHGSVDDTEQPTAYSSLLHRSTGCGMSLRYMPCLDTRATKRNRLPYNAAASCRDPTRSAAQAEPSSHRPRGVRSPLGGHTPTVASSESRPRPAPRSRGGHVAPPGTALRNPTKPPPSPNIEWARPPQRPPARLAQLPSSETYRSQRKEPPCT